MLQKGTIAKIYEHYFTAPQFSHDVMRALRDFFNHPDLDRGGSLGTTEMSQGLFNEWFLYDFVLSNGRTVLADFVFSNPLKISANEILLYQEMLNTNLYGLFEVKNVENGEGLMLENLQSGEKTYVYEKKLTSQVRVGDAFFGRIAKVADRYELIGADTYAFQGIDDKFKKLMRKELVKLTPKIAHEILEHHQ